MELTKNNVTMEKSSKKTFWSKVWSVTKAVLGYGWKLALVVIALSIAGDFVDDYCWRHDRKFLSRWEYVKYLSNEICGYCFKKCV